MKRIPLLLAVIAVCSWALAADDDFLLVDLQPYFNAKLDEDLHLPNLEGNNLTSLPRGKQTLEKVPFQIGDGFVQLASEQLMNKPEKVSDIKVGRAATKLHFLHATAFGGFEQAGPQFFTEDGTLVGEYTIHFEDKSFEVMPLVYGEDVRDWWNWDKDKETRRAKVAWRGSNNIADRFEVKLRLFLSTWKNPKPDAPISHIEYRSTKMSAAAPFCLAITGETK